VLDLVGTLPGPPTQGQAKCLARVEIRRLSPWHVRAILP
jgi:hypothetical protein